MNGISLSLAGLGFHLRAATIDVSLRLQPVYAPFITPDTLLPCAGTYEVVEDARGMRPPSDTVHSKVWDSFIWRLTDVGADESLLEVRDLQTQLYVPVARLARDFGSGRILARRRLPQPKYVLNHPEEQLILVHRLSYFDAGLVHSSGVVVDGRAVLFCGRSGAGKTTIERLWKAAGFRLLNDDRMVVRVIEGVPHACATPWHGEDDEVNPEIHPLGAVFHLNQAKENRIAPLRGAEAVARLYATTVSPFYSREGTARVIDTYSRALESVPSFDLYFTPDQRPVELCLNEVIRGTTYPAQAPSAAPSAGPRTPPR